MQITNVRGRKAISPVIATVILIAITLIAAIAIAGFVFGLFGSFTSTAQISEVSTSLVGGAAPTGSISFQNTGSANAAVNSITLTYAGQTCNTGTITITVITAGAGPTKVTIGTGGCIATAGSGTSFTGSASLSNGGQVQLSGVFQ